MPPNDWKEWSKFVLAELQRLGEQNEKIGQAVSNIRVEISILKVKSGVWGLIGGLIPVTIMLAIQLLLGR